MKVYLIASLALGLAAVSVSGQDKLDLSKPQQRAGYSIGSDIGSNFKRQGLDIDAKAFAAGFIASFTGQKTAMTEEEMKAAINQVKMDMMAKAHAKAKVDEAKAQVDGPKNLKEGEAFLAANAKQDGVKVLPSGLQVQGS